MFEDDTLMDYAPVPITTVLTGILKHYTVSQTVVIFHFFKLDPGPSQATVEDETIMDSVPVPVSTALPGISKHYTVIQTVVVFHFFK
jgi:hypothetical protein